MDITREIEAHAEQLRDVINEAERALERIEAAKNKTIEILEIANEVGVKTVGIGRRHASLGNADFPYNPTGSIFTPRESRINGWPSAWHIAEKSGIGFGAGNGGQHQIKSDSCVDGVYRCVKGVWTRIEGN